MTEQEARKRMNDESTPHDEDQDPAPVEHADAERVTGDEAGSGSPPPADDIEDDPSQSPQDESLRDLKGG